MGYVTKPTTLMKMWATSGVKETPSDSKIQQGWVVELPPYQFDNWLENRQDTFIAHVNQAGIPVWDAATDYQGGKSYVQGSNGIIYKALVTSINVDPTNPLNSSTWVRAFEDYGSVQVVQTSLDTHLTNYSTLAGIANVSTARNNLSVYSKVECDNNFALKAGSVSQTFSVADATDDTHAINKAQLYSLLNQATETVKGIAEIASQSEMNVGTNDTNIVTPLKGKATYLMRGNNLSDLTNVITARDNLGLTSAATTNLSDFLLKSGNLAGLANVSTSRSNLGLGSMATESTGDWLSKAGNLSGIVNVSTARTNLGLGSSSTRNVGTTVGTVAAGDDGRIVNAVQNNRQVVGTNGLVGGGYLWSDAVISMGTPSTVGSYSSNWASGTSHSHAFDINSFFGNRQLAQNGWYTFPGNFVIQWGQIARGDIISVTNFQINLHFPMNMFQAFAISRDTSQAVSLAVGGLQTTHFLAQAWERDGTSQGGNIAWFAFGSAI